MAVGQVEGYFLDTCILLPKPLEAVMQTCLRFIKEAQGKCFLSSSVKKEGLELIERSHETIIQNFHNELKPYLEKQGITEVSKRDGKIFADFFAKQKAKHKKLHPKRTNIPNEILSAIEGYVANQLHSIELGEKIPVDYFLAAISMQLAVVKHELEAPFRGTNLKEIDPTDSFFSAIATGSLSENRVLRNQADILHLASALEYQFRNNKWVIFVTTDQDEILSRIPQFKEMCLQCSKPEWAPDYYREMTKDKAPLEFVKEFTEPTNKQTLVVEALKAITSSDIQISTPEDRSL